MPNTQPNVPPLYIGLMSGTSLDGVDGVIAAIPDNYAGGPLHMPSSAYIPFSDQLRADLLALQSPGENEIEREAAAANSLARLYAECSARLLAQAGLSSERIRAIGVHGQTVRHRPDLNFTRQTNNPPLLAELTGIDVIADFRSRDIAAGGQGAPLVPGFHQAVFAEPGKTRVVLNIGGIANISVLHADGSVTGFDTGPGNLLMDAWISRHRGLGYDENGAWAASGSVCAELLYLMKAEPYLSLPPPKSTGRDLFNLVWLGEILARMTTSAKLNPEDVQATLTAYAAETMAAAIAANTSADMEVVYVCGGGAYNAHLMGLLSQALQANGTRFTLSSTAALGISPMHVEALAFAWLAHRFCLRRGGNLPAVTGAVGERILGALYPGC